MQSVWFIGTIILLVCLAFSLLYIVSFCMKSKSIKEEKLPIFRTSISTSYSEL